MTLPKPYPNGVLVCTYDDSFLSHYTIACDHHDRYGTKGVLFPILERIDQARKRDDSLAMAPRTSRFRRYRSARTGSRVANSPSRM